MLDALVGEDNIAELCRREGISQGIYYKWSEDLMEAGKKRLTGNTARAANTEELKKLSRVAKDFDSSLRDTSKGKGWFDSLRTAHCDRRTPPPTNNLRLCLCLSIFCVRVTLPPE